jgi:hypothetical protein
LKGKYLKIFLNFSDKDQKLFSARTLFSAILLNLLPISSCSLELVQPRSPDGKISSPANLEREEIPDLDRESTPELKMEKGGGFVMILD